MVETHKRVDQSSLETLACGVRRDFIVPRPNSDGALGHRATSDQDRLEAGNKPMQTDDQEPAEPLRSVHTTSFAEILDQFGFSVLVTTYQAGRLVVLRSDQGLLNTHFRGFNQPMGLAVSGPRLAIGVQGQICEFHNAPAVARRLTPPDRHDACFLPRVAHVTGAIQIHEMAWIGDELWFVNTAFSCLCTRSDQYSFAPQWRPWFVSELAPGDRCHLNGLAVAGGAVRYVTALGETDTPGGWRANKRDGAC